MKLLFCLDRAIPASFTILAIPLLLGFLLHDASALRHGLTQHNGNLQSGIEDRTADDGDDPKDANAWICKMAGRNGACGTRHYYDSNGVRQVNTYCPKYACCSKTACSLRHGCGRWCNTVFLQCSLSFLYYPEYSFGRCTCEQFGDRCDPNAVCIERNRLEGGVFCRCKEGYWGDGKTCREDPCAHNPCGVGSCTRVDAEYFCECPESHPLVTVNGRQSCQGEIDYCSASPCGSESAVKECKNVNDGYQCICMQGYELQDNRCVVDLCASAPCGPPEAVDSCRTEHQPTLRHRCQCAAGYNLRLFEDGNREVCEKNWCDGDPCGPPEHVASCSSSATGYSCLCKTGYDIQTDNEGKETCVSQDMCNQVSCGPPEAVEKCYSEGSSYRCICQPGYAEVFTNGMPKCTAEDPCRLGLCGAPEAVEECSTNGSSYSCKCKEGFFENTVDGRHTCVRAPECAAQCGILEAVKSCELTQNGEVKCICNAGFVYSYEGDAWRCVKKNVCSDSPCGDHVAVRRCTPVGSSYTCECTTGFTRQILADGKQVCTRLPSCAGEPCGPSAIVEACHLTEYGYTCKCKEGYVESQVNGSNQCTLAGGANGKSEERGKGFSVSLKASVGVALCVLLLAGVAVSVIVHKKRRATAENDTAPNHDSAVDQGFISGADEAVEESLGSTWAHGSSVTPSSPQVTTW